MALSIDEVIKRIPQWKDQTITYNPIPGGITNQNYKVDVGAESFVVRIGGENTGVHGIHRPAEYQMVQSAVRAGVAPEVLVFLPEQDVLVSRFVHGRTLTDDDVRQPLTLASIVTLMKRYHAIQDFSGRFSVFEVSRNYLRLAMGFGSPLPDNIGEIFALARRFEETLSRHQEAPVACHNDLLPANFIDDGSRLWLLDWEYAGQGDRFFDLANLSVNNGFNDVHDEQFMLAYFGQFTEAMWARLKLMRILSDLREGMWGMVQWGVATLDFDYEAYGRRHLARFYEASKLDEVETWVEAIEAEEAASTATLDHQ